MQRFLMSACSALRGIRREQRGATSILIAGAAMGLVAMGGLTIDAGKVLTAKSELDSGTAAAAMAGAYALLQNGATQTSVSTAVTGWTAANPTTKSTVTSTSVGLQCVTSTASLPGCNETSPNVVAVTQTATVSTNFLQAFGFSSFTLRSSASAAKAGGTATPLNVMFVLDSTASMGDTDSGCTVPGVSRPTRFQCAMYSVQSILKVASTSQDQFGLMAFPGAATQYNPTSHPCPKQPNSVPYYTTNIKYQIGTGLDATYNDGSGNLVNSSPLIQAVGNGTALTGCLKAAGGQGSHLAEALTKAQAALPVVTGTNNVIIVLSDGDFNASLSQLNNQSQYVRGQCDRAIAAAQAATAAGTAVYSVAYGSPNSGCSSGDTHNPCTTMQAIASDPTKFYSTNSSCKITGSANTIAQLPDIFRQIVANFSKPRLLTN